MRNQPNINERMRAILVDWLIGVHQSFKLVPETLYLTVNLIDRYLSIKEVERPKLQLVGVACLLIASKYEEIYPPEVKDCVYITDRAYTRQEVLDMERNIVKELESERQQWIQRKEALEMPLLSKSRSRSMKKRKKSLSKKRLSSKDMPFKGRIHRRFSTVRERS